MNVLPFENMTYYDFSDANVLAKQKEAIEKVRKELGKEYPNIIDGKEVYTDKKTVSYNPANKTEVIGTFQKSGKEDAVKAIEAADKAFKTWKNVPVQQRAALLLQASERIKARRMEINAWMILEAGKNFLEADADTCEAIDFLELYARRAVELGEEQPLTAFPGESNHYFYIPLGVGVCIPPWNFPFAIMIGITAATIVTGNTAVMKPSSDTPGMARIFSDIMREVGLPDGVLNFLVASGGEAGDTLVEHPRTRFINFTGSMDVGLRINAKAAVRQEGQIWIKRVIAEMGGKDGILVDHEADIDAAAQGTVKSAFGFQGQKCSACSRVIVDEKVYDEFVEKLIAEAKKLEVGDPTENYSMGPVVNEAAQEKILKYIEIGKEEGELVYGGNKVDLPGYFVEPTIIKDIKPNDRLAQEEIFGPVLAVIKSKNFDDGLEIINGTQYGLTGAVYTKNPMKIERAKREFHVGNLYVNRKCTGALVDVQPFGGFNMSGTDSKAGSRDYLSLFMQGKSFTQNLK